VISVKPFELCFQQHIVKLLILIATLLL